MASEEEILWERGLLGDKSQQSLLDTMVWMCGLYFALHSGQEHRSLRPGQIEPVEVPGKTPFLRYYEDVSKNNPGGLNHRKVQPKSVVHYANPNVLYVCTSSTVLNALKTDQTMLFISLHVKGLLTNAGTLESLLDTIHWGRL